MTSQDQYLPAGWPVKVGGTDFGEGRIQGPPSKMLPSLRDLALGTVVQNPRVGGEVHPRVTVELDFESKRVTGQIVGHTNKPGSSEQLILKLHHIPGRVSFDILRVLAFRVIQVELPVAEIH